jgi:site-specific recombinase XerD
MTVQVPGSLESFVEEYKRYQRHVRGLRESTLSGYGRIQRSFLRTALGQDPIDPGQLCCTDVMTFITSMSGRWSPRSMKTVRAALRSLLRFLRTEGLCDERLERAAPAPAHWRLSGLPRHLTDEQLAQVLASLDVSTPCGPRNRAIVLCLATLGLRPGEVADLRLDDIDWRAGTVQIRARKTRRGSVLPLPHEAGRTTAEYLCRHRPKTAQRRVFVQHVGRRRGEPITGNAVSAVVVAALRRAGVESPISGAYVLRHTVASRMVRHGASLKEVADLLGHRCLDTTAIYAKLNLPALREVALPWPELVR